MHKSVRAKRGRARIERAIALRLHEQWQDNATKSIGRGTRRGFAGGIDWSNSPDQTAIQYVGGGGRSDADVGRAFEQMFGTDLMAMANDMASKERGWLETSGRMLMDDKERAQ